MSEKKLKIAFLVQGEGRGHLSQAIAAKQLLEKKGHEICAVVVGKSKFRHLPDYFQQNFNVPIERIQSPNLVRDKRDKGIRIVWSLIYNFFRIPVYLTQLPRIHGIISKSAPDLILNFHEFMIGVYCFFYRPHQKVVSIAHQYIYLHPDFRFTGINRIEKLMLQLVNFFTLFGSSRILALNFSRKSEFRKGKIKVIPPLIREEILNTKPTLESSTVVYLLNAGYIHFINNLARNFSDMRFLVFSEIKPKESSGNIEFFTLDADLFMEKLSGCSCLVTTAGFESVCEANLFGKQVFLFPVKNHAEQKINYMEAIREQLALPLERFGEIAKFDHDKHKSFKNWVLDQQQFITEIESIANKQ